MPPGTRRPQPVPDVLGPVVDGVVEPELVDEPGALLLAPAMPTTVAAPSIRASCPTTEPVAPAAPDTTTVSPGGTGRCRACRSRRSCRSPRGRRAPPRGRGPGGPRSSGRRRRRPARTPANPACRTPCRPRQGVGAGGHHLTDPTAADDLPDADRREVAGRVVHPGADGRVDRQVARPRPGPGPRPARGPRPCRRAAGRVVDQPVGTAGQQMRR